MKEELFLYLENEIPLQSIEFDKVKQYDYVKSNVSFHHYCLFATNVSTI